jgi:signal peptidase I
VRRILRLALIGLALLVGAVVSLVVVGILAGQLRTYRIPSSAMEPTLHCPRPEVGCEARFADG